MTSVRHAVSAGTAAPIAVLIVAAACGDQRTCSDDPAIAPIALVVNADTHEGICGATVLAGGVPATEGNVTCGYYTLPFAEGVYTVTASAAGFSTESVRVQVTTDDCGKLRIEPDGPRDGLPGYAGTVTVGLNPQ